MHFVEVPLDILDIIFSYLDAKSFVAVCSTCKAFYDPDIRLNPRYWRRITRQTFRVPNQPVTHGDGSRWQKLYRRLHTQSRVYTWGNDDHGALGHALLRCQAQLQHLEMQPHTRFRRALTSYHESWPTEMEMPTKGGGTTAVGTIADMQAGGWSTTILNSKGALYIVGRMDRLRPRSFAPIPSRFQLHPLQYPPGFPSPVQRWDPCTAIKQFSSGRIHVLGLSDSGRIWSWDDELKHCLNLKFLHFDIRESTEVDKKISRGSVTKVVAGWDKSSAYIMGNGIVIWDVAHLPPPAQPLDPENPDFVDTVLIPDSVAIPCTQYRKPKGRAREPDVETQDLGERIGEVVNWIVLENFIVLVTDIGKVFTAKITSTENQALSVSLPLEITELQSRSSSSSPADDDFILDVQGSFRRFAVFKRSGEVLIADTTLLSLVYEAHYSSTSLVTVPPPAPKKIPALQNTGVVALAFGDYHMHALHGAGHITSYGTEPQHCGALGLGGFDGDREARIRGIGRGAPAFDGNLLPQCYRSGRRVWFETEKNAWMKFMASGGVNPDEAQERIRMIHQEASVQAELSEWIEQRGNHWYGDSDRDSQNGNQDSSKDSENDGLGAYFALSVTAAGWHSGALVLVNEELVQKSREKCIVPDPESAMQSEIVEEVSQATTSQDIERQGNGWSPTALLASARNTLNSWSRWFLGLQDRAGVTAPIQSPDLDDEYLRTLRGVRPKPGYKYVWAGEPFPRLRLSDGREMPGEVEFTEWIEERPNFEGMEDVEF